MAGVRDQPLPGLPLLSVGSAVSRGRIPWGLPQHRGYRTQGSPAAGWQVPARQMPRCWGDRGPEQGRPGLTCTESTGRGRGQLCSEWNGTGEGRPAAPSSQQPLLWGGDPMEPSPAPQGPPADIRTVAAAPAKGPPTPAPVQCVLNSAGEARVQPLPAPGNQAARQGCYPSPQAAGLGRPPGAWSVR